jgi:hypothetical protein
MRADSKVLASLFDERRGAHSGVPLEDLADTFWVLTHVDGYRHLVEEAGWSTERYAAWLEEMLTMVVLGTSGGGGPAPSRKA